MLLKRTISTFGLCLVVLFSSLFLSGCSPKPFLTQDDTYVILSVSPLGETQSEVIELPWNTNMAIMQKLLLEASFVLSDLHTPSALELSNPAPITTTSLQANFSKPKRMTFVIDQNDVTLDVQSLQIEVKGEHIGQVTLNQTLILQGIDNPNLESAFEALINMLHNPM